MSIESDRPFQHSDRLPILIAIMRQCDAAQVQVIGFLVARPRSVLVLSACRTQRRNQTLPHLRRDLLPHRHQILGGNVHRLLPQHAIVADIDRRHRQLQLCANLLVMSHHDPADVHVFSSLLHVHIRAAYFTVVAKGRIDNVRTELNVVETSSGKAMRKKSSSLSAPRF